jgi:hypothetical protein
MAALKLNLRCRDLAPTEATPRLRENYVIAPVAGKKIRSRARSLRIVDRHNLCHASDKIRCASPRGKE